MDSGSSSPRRLKSLPPHHPIRPWVIASLWHSLATGQSMQGLGISDGGGWTLGHRSGKNMSLGVCLQLAFLVQCSVMVPPVLAVIRDCSW